MEKALICVCGTVLLAGFAAGCNNEGSPCTNEEIGNVICTYGELGQCMANKDGDGGTWTKINDCKSGECKDEKTCKDDANGGQTTPQTPKCEGESDLGTVICVDNGTKGMIERCSHDDTMGYFFSTDPTACENGCNDAHTGCKD